MKHLQQLFSSLQNKITLILPSKGKKIKAVTTINGKIRQTLELKHLKINLGRPSFTCVPNTKCADVLKLNSAYICQICKSFQICAYLQICRSLTQFVKSVLKPWIYPSNIPAVEETVIKFQTWWAWEFWETLHPSPAGLCQIMMEVFHFKTYTSTAHDSLHHILPTLSFWWLRWFICLSRIWFFYFCFFRRDDMLLYLVVGCYFERSLVRESEMFCHQFYLRQWVFPWWVGIKGGGKVTWWMAELIELHTHWECDRGGLLVGGRSQLRFPPTCSGSHHILP